MASPARSTISLMTNGYLPKGIYSEIKDYGYKWYYFRPQPAPPNSILPKEPAIFDRQHQPGRTSLHDLVPLVGTVRRPVFSDSVGGESKADFSWIGAKLTCGYDPKAQTNPGSPTFGSNCEFNPRSRTRTTGVSRTSPPHLELRCTSTSPRRLRIQRRIRSVAIARRSKLAAKSAMGISSRRVRNRCTTGGRLPSTR